MSLSTCLRVKLHLSASRSRELKHRCRQQKPSPFQKETRRGIKQSCIFAAQSNTKAAPFPSLRVHSKHEGTNVKCKPNCAPGGTLSKTRLASCSGGILAGSTGECWRDAPARCWPDTRQDPPARDAQRDTWRDPLASYSGILSGILGGIHWRAALAGYSAGSLASRSGGILGRIHWRDTRRDPLASSSGGILGGILGGIHWRAALAGYWVGAWCRSIANADSNIKSNNPFLSGVEKANTTKYILQYPPPTNSNRTSTAPPHPPNLNWASYALLLLPLLPVVRGLLHGVPDLSRMCPSCLLKVMMQNILNPPQQASPKASWRDKLCF